jgi:hypothetical protein
MRIIVANLPCHKKPRRKNKEETSRKQKIPDGNIGNGM